MTPAEPRPTDAAPRSESWKNFREWVEVTLNEFLAPDDLVATDKTVDAFAQILECRAKELAKEIANAE